MTAGAASGNNRERRLAQSKGNPRRPNARIFLRIQSRCDLPQPGFCGQNAYVSDQREEHTKSHSIRPATPRSEPSQRSNHSPGFGSGLYHRGATRTDRVGRHPAVPERNTPSRSSPSPVPCFAPQFRSPAPPPRPRPASGLTHLGTRLGNRLRPGNLDFPHVALVADNVVLQREEQPLGMLGGN